MGGNVIPHYTQFTHLGAPVRVTPAISSRQRIHPIVKSLLDRLQPRFAPVKWLATNATGGSIPMLKTLYIRFLGSVVNYVSLALSKLPKIALQQPKKF